MASPLFAASRSELLRPLRLSNTLNQPGSDVEEIIDEGIQYARLRLRRGLGADVITSLLSISFTETPTTDDQYRRAAANLAESLALKIALFRRLPVLFMGVSGIRDRVWNEEGAYREKASTEIEALIAEWNIELEELMSLAKLGPDQGQTRSGAKGFMVHPDYASDEVRANRSKYPFHTLLGD